MLNTPSTKIHITVPHRRRPAQRRAIHGVVIHRSDQSRPQHLPPWLLPRTGKAGVLEFFQIVGTLKVSDFRVLSLMAGENQVAAEIEIVTERFRDEECHLWRFDDAGKIDRMRHYVDTAKHAAAAARSVQAGDHSYQISIS